MNKLRLIAVSAMSAGVLTVGSVGLASAATTNTNVGNSGIPRSVFHDERQAAEADVLKVSASDLTTAHKNHTVRQLVSKAGLTEKSFKDQVNTDLTAKLKAKGYSDEQIKQATQQKKLHHLKHMMKAEKAKS